MSGTCIQNQHGRPIHAKAMCDSWDPTLSHCVMQTYTYAHKCAYIRHIYTYPYIFDPSAYCIYTDVYKIFPRHKYTYIFTHINIT